MKVISIKQPWAALVVSGAKTLELRSWNSKYRGELAIHTGLTVDQHGPWGRFPAAFDPIRGAVVGGVRMVDSRLMRPEDAEAACHEFVNGIWVHVYENPFSFSEPIPMKGKLGIFNMPDEVYYGRNPKGV